MLMLGQCPWSQLFLRQTWIAKLHDAGSGVPRGVAPAMGAIFPLPSAHIFRLAGAA
jgi:Flp pilus assembly protein protease CpaA